MSRFPVAARGYGLILIAAYLIDSRTLAVVATLSVRLSRAFELDCVMRSDPCWQVFEVYTDPAEVKSLLSTDSTGYESKEEKVGVQ